MSVWDWVIEFEMEAAARGDTERLRLRHLLQSATATKETDPDLALAGLNAARKRAEQLKEPWWILFFDHWRLQILLHFKGDYQTALDIAVKAALEARKPAYAEFPQRVCLHEDLVYCYVGTDPIAHADAIREALAFMESEAAPDQECRLCIQECAATFALGVEDLDEATRAANRELELADGGDMTSNHHAFSAHAKLCDIAARQKDWAALPEHVVAGMEAGRDIDRPRVLAELLVWQALLARMASEESRATQLLLRAARQVDRLASLPYDAYFNALCCFHEQAGDFDQATAVREREIARITGKGLHQREVRSQMERCRYLARLGRLTEPDREAAREAARRLRDPSPWLARLDSF